MLDFPLKERLRDFNGMRPCFDALSFWITLYGRERARIFARPVPEQNGTRRIGAVAADNHERRLVASASMVMERFCLDAGDLYQFLHELIRLYEDYERNERSQARP